MIDSFTKYYDDIAQYDTSLSRSFNPPLQVRKNLVSSGASISAQLQEDVYQYMQAHNRKIVVGQSWVRTMRAGFADVNTTFTLVCRIHIFELR